MRTVFLTPMRATLNKMITELSPLHSRGRYEFRDLLELGSLDSRTLHAVYCIVRALKLHGWPNA